MILHIALLFQVTCGPPSMLSLRGMDLREHFGLPLRAEAQLLACKGAKRAIKPAAAKAARAPKLQRTLQAAPVTDVQEFPDRCAWVLAAQTAPVSLRQPYSPEFQTPSWACTCGAPCESECCEMPPTPQTSSAGTTMPPTPCHAATLDTVEDELLHMAIVQQQKDAGGITAKEMELEKELADCVDGGVDLRTKWGLRFTRDPTGGKASTYFGSREDKARFRRDWAETQLRERRRQRERRGEYKHVDVKHGRWMPFSRIWKLQGGKDDPKALEAARNIARSCIATGGEWVRVNPRSKRVELIDLEEGFDEKFSKSWTLYETTQQFNEAVDADMAGKEGKEAKAKNKPSKQGKKGKEAKEEEPNADPGPKAGARAGEPGQKVPKAKKSLGVNLAEAYAAKKEYASITMQAAGLQQEVASWPWAHQDAEELNHAMRELSVVLQGFGNHFLIHEQWGLKKKFKGKEQILDEQALAFTKAVKMPLQRVGRATKLLLAMKAARDAVHGSL